MYTIIEQDSGFVRISITGNRMQFASTLARVRSIPGRSYDPDTKLWTIPESALDFLAAGAEDLDIVESTIQTMPKQFEVDLVEVDMFRGRIIPFQTVGASFLYSMQRACLLDEFGLGKTIQAIRAILKGKVHGDIDRTLVVTKSSLKAQWAREIANFTDLVPIVIGGSRSKRAKQWKAAEEVDVIIINYELLLQDMDFKAASLMHFDCIVADEAQMLRTRTTKRTRALLKLTSEHFYALTATPIQNRPEEIYSLFKFIDPEVLGRWKDFERAHIQYDSFYKPIAYHRLPELAAKISPYILKRAVEDVGEQLPEVSRIVYEVDMTPLQKKLHAELSEEYEIVEAEYKSIMEKVIADDVADEVREIADTKKARMLGILNLMIEVCDTPQLLTMSDSFSVRRRVEGVGNDVLKSHKLTELIDFVTDFTERNERIVVFSQYPRMLAIIGKQLDRVGIGYATLHGGMSSVCHRPDGDCGRCDRFRRCEFRQKSVWRFWNDPECLVFLSTDAGGAGLNLQCASCLVNYDLPWNPSDADQRNGRIRRIGSEYSNITIVDMVTADGIDKTLLSVHDRKREVIDAILEPSWEEKRFIQAITEHENTRACGTS